METEPLTREQKNIRLHLAKVAAKRGVIYYSDLCRECRLPYTMTNVDHRNQLAHDLGSISEQEVLDYDRPMLSSVVVDKHTLRPGKGFFDLADDLYDYEDREDFYVEEMRDTHNFWASPDGKMEIVKLETEVLRQGM